MSCILRLCLLQVVVKPAAEEEANGRSSSNGGAGSSHLYRPRVAACLPQLQPALSKTAGAVDLGAAVQLQLLSPEPGALLEADRTQLFAVLAPAWASVAVGSEQSGWVVLQRQQEQQLEAAASGSGANCSEEFCVFSGSVVLPRISACYVAVQDFAQQQGGSWLPVLGLHVRPPVSSCDGLQQFVDRQITLRTVSPLVHILQQAEHSMSASLMKCANITPTAACLCAYCVLCCNRCKTWCHCWMRRMPAVLLVKLAAQAVLCRAMPHTCCQHWMLMVMELQAGRICCWRSGGIGSWQVGSVVLRGWYMSQPCAPSEPTLQQRLLHQRACSITRLKPSNVCIRLN